MDKTDLKNYKNIYLQTAKEYIDSMFSSYSKLGKNPLDKKAINDLHISSHSLRSQSQVMKFANMASLCRIIEKVSNDILNGVSKIDDEFMVLLKNSIDVLNLKLAKIEKGDAETNSA